ncbi:hypothetical protein E2986_08709 [Frieseomelitta varia]|uniref:Uncharacterized protein n=1 Tax=Frieseomelitta varia TaxID=561572 RepID=A0A833RA33_9HYME|nr:hypothetical protein E2986_08709 [Frieseomelitta varia]
MAINPMKWKTRNILYTSLTLLIFYVLFVYKKKHHILFEEIIKDSNPVHVWEYVADFSNMKTLNPTIEDFNIIAESGNYDHWKYSVEYTEHLSHIPIIRNTAHGHYAIREDNNVESISQFRFDRDGATDTKCIETVQYECPIAFSLLCYKEVMYQRTEIMERLKLKFSKTKIP